MSLLQQLVQFLSQPPESLVYHVVTLLALQATFWLALWHLRRHPSDSFSRRLVWSSGGIIIGRLIILIASLLITTPTDAAGILPPLERGVDTATAILIVWTLAPQFQKFPRLGDVLLLIGLIIIGFLFAFFTQSWLQRVQDGMLLGGYPATNQATIWETIQLAILALGLALVFYKRESEWPLRLAVILTLFITHLVTLISQYVGNLETTDITYWVRLGNLIAFPLLAILTYRHNLTALLPSGGFGRSMVENFAFLLQLAQSTISAPDLDKTLDSALKMAAESLDADYWALALLEPGPHQRLNLLGHRKAKPSDAGITYATETIQLNTSDLPALRQAIESGKQIEVFSEGQGARQFHQIAEQLKLSIPGSLLIEPLVASDKNIGLMLLGNPAGQTVWSEEEKRLATAMAAYLAQVIDNASQYEPTQVETAYPVWQDESTELSDEDRINTLERHLAEEQSRARELAASLLLADAATQAEHIKKLEQEIDDLRDSLVEAENAMALAAASDAGVSTDWVMRTVSRYSGELEEAQIHIGNLEKRLVQLSNQNNRVSLIAHAREMRTPLTSLGVYTDLLLGESLGILGAQQVDVLERMKTSIQNLTAHLDKIILETVQHEQAQDGRVFIDVRETIESAINSISSYMQAKRLKLDLLIEDDLPPLPTFDNDFYLIVSRLLGSACLVSQEDGHVLVQAKHEGEKLPPGLSSPATGFLHLAVSDSAAREGQELVYRFLSGQQEVSDESLPEHLVQAGDNLSIVLDLVQKLGGRTWVDQDSEAGSVVTILLPLKTSEMAA